MEVKTFRSIMPGAPVLSGTAGSLISVLDACLVNGFGLQSASSVVVTSGVAVATFPATHAALAGSVLQVTGATPALLNGLQRVTAVTANTVSWATTAAAGTATGTITVRLAPAGWTKPFSGTNLAVYRSADPMATGMFLRVDDTSATFARVVGYEQMTGVTTGAGLFPLEAQMAGGAYWPKSGAADNTARAWILFADSRKFYLHFVPFSTTAGIFGGVTHGFGDDLATRPGGDAYACSLAASFQSSVSNMHQGGFDAPALQTIAMPRGFTGLGSSALHAAYPYTGNGAGLSGADATLGAFPSEVDGGLRLSRCFLAVPNRSPRCDLPGMYDVPQSEAFATFKRGDTIPGTGALAGRSLMAVNPTSAPSSASTTANTGTTFIDTTGPWR